MRAHTFPLSVTTAELSCNASHLTAWSLWHERQTTHAHTSHKHTHFHTTWTLGQNAKELEECDPLTSACRLPHGDRTLGWCASGGEARIAWVSGNERQTVCKLWPYDTLGACSAHVQAQTYRWWKHMYSCPEVRGFGDKGWHESEVLALSSAWTFSSLQHWVNLAATHFSAFINPDFPVWRFNFFFFFFKYMLSTERERPR